MVTILCIFARVDANTNFLETLSMKKLLNQSTRVPRRWTSWNRLPPLRIGPTASKSLREWGGTQKRRKIKNFKLAIVEVNCEIAGRPL